MHAGARIAHNIVTQNVLLPQPWSRFTAGAGISATDTSNGRRQPPPVIIEHNVVTNNTSAGGAAGGIGVYQPGEIRHNIVTDNRSISRRRSVGGGVELGMDADFDLVLDGNYIWLKVAFKF